MLSTHKFNQSRTASRLLLSGAGLLLATALFALPAAAQSVQATFLTSDIVNISANTDANLVNAWGMSFSPSGPWWVSDNGTGLSTLYNASGTPQELVVTIPSGNGVDPGAPTGQVYNGTTDFKIVGTPAHFLFAGEDGTISGWYTGTTAQLVAQPRDCARPVHDAVAHLAGARHAGARCGAGADSW